MKRLFGRSFRHGVGPRPHRRGNPRPFFPSTAEEMNTLSLSSAGMTHWKPLSVPGMGTRVHAGSKGRIRRNRPRLASFLDREVSWTPHGIVPIRRSTSTNQSAGIREASSEIRSFGPIPIFPRRGFLRIRPTPILRPREDPGGDGSRAGPEPRSSPGPPRRNSHPFVVSPHPLRHNPAFETVPPRF